MASNAENVSVWWRDHDILQHTVLDSRVLSSIIDHTMCPVPSALETHDALYVSVWYEMYLFIQVRAEDNISHSSHEYNNVSWCHHSAVVVLHMPHACLCFLYEYEWIIKSHFPYNTPLMLFFVLYSYSATLSARSKFMGSFCQSSDTGARIIVWLSQCQRSDVEWYGQNDTKPTQNKTKREHCW